jgi:hypothetical protein
LRPLLPRAPWPQNYRATPLNRHLKTTAHPRHSICYKSSSLEHPKHLAPIRRIINLSEANSTGSGPKESKVHGGEHGFKSINWITVAHEGPLRSAEDYNQEAAWAEHLLDGRKRSSHLIVIRVYRGGFRSQAPTATFPANVDVISLPLENQPREVLRPNIVIHPEVWRRSERDVNGTGLNKAREIVGTGILKMWESSAIYTPVRCALNLSSC